MKKVKLDLDELRLESFDTVGRKQEGRGTVEGHDNTLAGSCSPCTIAYTCLGCGDTVEHTCGGDGATCGGICGTDPLNCADTWEICDSFYPCPINSDSGCTVEFCNSGNSEKWGGCGSGEC